MITNLTKTRICNYNLNILPPLTSSMSLAKTATLNGPGGVGDTIDYTFVVTNTGGLDINNITISDSITIINGGPSSLPVGANDTTTFTGTYVITQADVNAGQVVNVATVSGTDTDLNLVQAMDSTTTPTVVVVNLFFSIDGINPIAWTGVDYVDQCIRVDSDSALIRGITEATTYINANYPGQVLDASDGSWSGPASGPILVHDATLLMTNTTALPNTLVRIPILNGVNDVFIDWGDGSPLEISPGFTSNPSHTYVVAGTYQVSVCGDLPRISWTIASPPERQFLRSIDQWGDTGATESSLAQSDGITSLDPNLSNTITDLSQFFFGADSNPDMTFFDMSNVTNCNQMFFLTNGPNPNTTLWDVSNVTDMANMFALASAANPDVTSWDVSNVTTFNSMFENADLATPNTALWNTSSAIDMAEMFQNCALANPDVTSWDVSNVTNFSNMFNNAPLANPTVTLWDVSTSTNLQGVFLGAITATPNVTNWDVSGVTNFSNLFYNAFASAVDVSLWNTSNATNMSSMFRGINSDPDVSGFDVSGVTNFSGMFNDADSADPDVSTWNMGSATNLSSMFALTAIADPDVSLWNTANVTNFGSMFLSALTAAPDVSSWNTSSATIMLSMFAQNTSDPDVSLWDVSSVTNMSSMFNGNTVANPDVSSWITTSVTNLSSMFSGASAAIPDVSSFDVSNVTTFNAMFNAATLADPDCSTWDIQSINFTFASMSNIFNTSGISVANYDAALIQFDSVATLHSLTGYNMGTVPQNYTIATSGAARANLVGPLSWSITDNGGI